MDDQPDALDDVTTTPRPVTVEEIVASRPQGLVAIEGAGQPPRPDVLREVVGDEIVNPLREGILLLVLTIPALLVAIPIFAVSALLFVAVGSVAGYPSGTIGGVVGIAWFVGTLVLVFLAFVAIYRLGRRFVRRRRVRTATRVP